MKQLVVATSGTRFSDVTAEVADWLGSECVADGLVTIYCRHTSASLVIQENADPAVLRDLGRALERLAPRSASYEHESEGPDDMPAHIRTMLTGASVSIPVREGRMTLGTWQAIYLAEHRSSPHKRELVLHYLGTYA